MKILSVVHYHDERVSCAPGDIVELDDHIAADWLAQGFGLRAPAAPKVETAAAPKIETATGRRQRRGDG